MIRCIRFNRCKTAGSGVPSPVGTDDTMSMLMRARASVGAALSYDGIIWSGSGL